MWWKVALGFMAMMVMYIGIFSMARARSYPVDSSTWGSDLGASDSLTIGR
jgi:hypothetical protein